MPCTLHRLKRWILVSVRLAGGTVALIVAGWGPAAANPGVPPSPSLYRSGIATFFGLKDGGEVYGLQFDPFTRVLTQSKKPVWQRSDVIGIMGAKYALSFFALTSNHQIYFVSLVGQSPGDPPSVQFVQNTFFTGNSKFDPGPKKTPGVSGSAGADPATFQPKAFFGCAGDIFEIQNNGHLLQSTVTGGAAIDPGVMTASPPALVGTGWQDFDQVDCGGRTPFNLHGFSYNYDEIYAVARKDDPNHGYKKGDLRFYLFDADRKTWHPYNSGLNFAALPPSRVIAGDNIILTSRNSVTAKPTLVQNFVIGGFISLDTPELNWSTSGKDKKVGSLIAPDLHSFKQIIFDRYEIYSLP